MRRFLKLLIALIALPPAAAALYLSAALILERIPAALPQDLPPHEAADIRIYLISNGVHTDIAMPLAHPAFDWSAHVSTEHTRSGSPDARYVAIGWGDKGFYLNTPAWRDLTLQTALTAATGRGQSALHVSFYSELHPDERTVALSVSPAQYRRLAANIAADFDTQNHRSRPIAGAHYHDRDAFYEARGRYSLFNTCNTWTNRQLTQAAIGGVYWTPFAHGVLNAFR